MDIHCFDSTKWEMTHLLSLINKINIQCCHACVHNRLQMTSKCGKNKKGVLMFLPHFEIFCDVTEQMHSNMKSTCFMY